MAEMPFVSRVHPTIVRENVWSGILLNRINLPLINQWWNAGNLAMRLEVEKRVDAEPQVASDKIPDFAAFYLVLPF